MNNVAQKAAIAALNGPQDEAEQFRQAFDRRRQLIVSELSKIDGLVVPNPLGAFYVYPDVQGLLGRTWGGVTPTTSLELADLILDQAEVAVVPARPSAPRDTSACRTPSATTSCSRACSASSDCSPDPRSNRRPPPVDRREGGLRLSRRDQSSGWKPISQRMP